MSAISRSRATEAEIAISKGTKMRIQHRLALISLALISVVVAAHKIYAESDDDVIESFPVDSRGGLLVIPGEVNGKEYHFVLDTGSTNSVFDMSLKAALRPLRTKRRINGAPPLDLYECGSATVGHSKLRAGQTVICRDLASLKDENSDRNYGILGMDFLAGKVVQIDFDRGRLSFLKDAERADGCRVPLRIGDDDLSYVDLELPGLGDHPFLVDTGCNGFRTGYLSKSTFDFLVRAEHIRVFDRPSTSWTFEGTKTTRIGSLDRQSFQSMQHESQIYSEDSSDDSCNGLGLGYLSRFCVTFDFPNRILILKKGTRFANALPANPAGVDIVSKGGPPIVGQVDEGGLAWKLGLRPGDRIILVDGKDARKLELDELGFALSSIPAGAPVTFLPGSGFLPRKVWFRQN
jgi:hypothetical protein